MATINRRDLISGLLGAAALRATGCSTGDSVSQRLQIEGELFAPDFETGHRFRLATASPKSSESGRSNWAADTIGAIEEWREIPVVIVGGGIAGLCAAWRLKRSGFEQFQLLELEDHLGGTSRSGEHRGFQFPWGAHYITTPMPENTHLIALLREMGVVEGLASDGKPVIAEEYLCREPEERVFADEHWQEGLFPVAGATQDDLDQLASFHKRMLDFSLMRDEHGKRFFALPIALSSEDPQARKFDQISMLQWMEQQGWTSSKLRWYVDYACRDDYGLTIDRTSAWAGILYYASRIQNGSLASQDVITWPSGNGHIVKHLQESLKAHLNPGMMVAKIDPKEQSERSRSCELIVYDKVQKRFVGYRCDRVIFAAPQFVAKHVIEDFRSDRSTAALDLPFQYGWWLVANLHLSSRPSDSGFPMSWDNIIYESKSLGYVVATHQLGVDHGPTVLTWYYPFADAKPPFTREQLLSVPWSDWVEMVLSDLEVAHREIRSLVTRVDVMRWGHAMVQPYTNFLWSETRRMAAMPDRNVHFANTDLSGLALLEEAVHHGVRAADEVLDSLDKNELAG